MKKLLCLILVGMNALAFGAEVSVSADQYPVVLDPIIVNTVANCAMSYFELTAANGANSPYTRGITFTTGGDALRTAFDLNAGDLYGPAIYAPASFSLSVSPDANDILAVGASNLTSYTGTAPNEVTRYVTTLNANLTTETYEKLNPINSNKAMALTSSTAGQPLGFSFSARTPVKDNVSAFTWQLRTRMKCASNWNSTTGSATAWKTTGLVNNETVKNLDDYGNDTERSNDGVFTNVQKMNFSTSDYQYQPLLFIVLGYSDSNNNHAMSLVTRKLNNLLAASCSDTNTSPKVLAKTVLGASGSTCQVNLVPTSYTGIDAVKTVARSADRFPFYAQFSTDSNNK